MRAILFCLCLLSGFCSLAQTYPQGYFRNPLGIPISLAGNFGECRPGHFHMGLDLKTEGRENLPVYAAAGGYVSRIKTEPGGFGHAIYLTHPAGFTTVYAHLNDFVPALQKHLRELQYARQSWEIDETLEPGFFFFTQGQQIAWSGNTGGSTAPHLHFEIRDTKTERALNPQLFGFEIKDTRSPVPVSLTVYDRSKSIFSNSNAPATFRVVKRGGGWVPDVPGPVLLPAMAGFGVEVWDYANGSSNTLAIHTASVVVDDEEVSRIELSEIGYDETRYLQAYADYSSFKWIQLLFRLPGNGLKRIYPVERALRLGNEPKLVRIRLADISGNISEIQFFAKARADKPATPMTAPPCGVVLQPGGAARTWTGNNLRLSFPEASAYDTMCITPHERGSVFHDGFAYRAPIHRPFRVSIRPAAPVPFALRSKMVVSWPERKTDFRNVPAQSEPGGWYGAEVRSFEQWSLQADTTAPSVRAVGAVQGNLSKARGFQFTAVDPAGIREFRGEIDGQWVLFEQHGNKWTYVFDEHCPRGKHMLTISATDEVGNESRRQFAFTR